MSCSWSCCNSEINERWSMDWLSSNNCYSDSPTLLAEWCIVVWLLSWWYLSIVSLRAYFCLDIWGRVTSEEDLDLKGGGKGIDDGCLTSDLPTGRVCSGLSSSSVALRSVYFTVRLALFSLSLLFACLSGYYFHLGGVRLLTTCLIYLDANSSLDSMILLTDSAGTTGVLLLILFITWSISFRRFFSRVLVTFDWSKLD